MFTSKSNCVFNLQSKHTTVHTLFVAPFSTFYWFKEKQWSLL